MLGRVPLPKELGKPEPNNEVGSGRSGNFSRATVEVRGAPPRVRSRAGIDLPSLPPKPTLGETGSYCELVLPYAMARGEIAQPPARGPRESGADSNVW